MSSDKAVRLGNLAIDIRKNICNKKCAERNRNVIYCSDCTFLKKSNNLLVRLYRNLWFDIPIVLTEKELFALRFKYNDLVEAYKDPNAYVSSMCK